jgi:type II secretory pathway component PulF
MATFEYHAIRTDAEEEKSFCGGVVIAKSRQDAKAKLRELGLKATRLKKERGMMALLKWFDADIR